MSKIDLGPRYECLRPLGSGGMGSVFLVRDLYLRRDLSLKRLHQAPATRQELEPFQREFALLCEIEHPGIARAFDFGFLDGHPFFTTEFITGEALGSVGSIADGARLIRIASDLAEAAAFLHRSGILHLDIKPSNVIAPPARSPRAAVLIDFGLFRRGITVRGAVSSIQGSLPYMAPECFRGEVGPWTDVYALGVTLYRLATGVFPRSGASRESSRLDDEAAWDPVPSAPSTAGSPLPAIDDIILRCLTLDPGARYPSAADLLEDLRRLDRSATAPAPARASVSPTIGRGVEVAEVDRFLDAVLSRKAAPVALLVTGRPGMGQTHLFREMKVRAQTRGLRFYLETGYAGRLTPSGSLFRCLGACISEAHRASRARWESFLDRLERPRRPSRSAAGEAERRLRRAGEILRATGLVHEPMVLAVDGLQHWDEVSIALLLDLVRHLGQKPAAERPPIGIAIGYREEGTAVPLLRELTTYLLQGARAGCVTLAPLGLKETLALYRTKGGAGGPQGLALLQETGGCPAEIVGAATGSVGKGTRSPPSRAAARKLAVLSADERRAVSTLVLLERPASLDELRFLLEAPPKTLEKTLSGLEATGLAARSEADSGAEVTWLPGPGAAGLARLIPLDRRRRLHGSLAERLLRLARRKSGLAQPRADALTEAARHFQRAARKRELVEYGLEAARRLKSTFQNRAALDMLRAVLGAIPSRRLDLRLRTALEAADLQARLGDTEEGIRLLRDLLPEARTASATAHARVLYRLAILHSRRGDFQRAEALFREAAGAAPARSLGRKERLEALNEQAAMKAIVGAEADALALAEAGLHLAGTSRDPEVREVALNLHATRGNVALRAFKYDQARDDFERSLEIAEAIGSPANQAAVLNNLGILHSQCDRYGEAIRAFRDAEKTCLRLDEGPSLVSIYGNLAVLHSKTGDWQAMERVLDEAEKLSPGSVGKRQEFFLQHAWGLCLVNRGRYAEARRRLEEAIRMGSEMGDRHVAAFDEVYRAEALVFEGSYSEAAAELDRLAQPGPVERIRRMALARRALLAALGAEDEGSERAAKAYKEIPAGRPIPFLDAWDGVYLGWAHSISGRTDEALARLGPAVDLFRKVGAWPALSFAEWVSTEALFLARRRARLDPPREALEPRAGDLAAALWPLLQARLLLDGPAGPESRARSADLLARAGAALAANPLPEWKARVEALRGVLAGARGASGGARERQAIALSIREDHRRAYLESEHWKVWTGLPRAVHSAARLPSPPGEADSVTAEMSRGTAAPLRGRLVAHSKGMRAVSQALDKLRGSELPVLICGETGSGKELLARIIHQESRRASGPFAVIDCVTLPPPLLETELFGARAGAFTDLTEDRAGILASASGGTVLIDEIAGAPQEVQAKLLRVLSDSMIRPVGGEETKLIDVRFLFTTARHLESEAREGRFRADLLHRIQVLTLHMPPLRERPEDLADLVDAILEKAGGQAVRLEPAALDRLRELPWPGNVRELRNLLLRLRLESSGEISVEALERARADAKTSTLFPRNLLAGGKLDSLKDQLERDFIVYHYRRLGGDTRALSAFLGLGRRQLYRRCARLGVLLRELGREATGTAGRSRR